MNGEKPVILVANDDPDMLCLTVAQLQELGFPLPITCENGQAAIEIMKTQRPDLVISDVSMPFIDGFQLCRILKSPLFPGSDTIPVILASATYRDVIAEQVARNVNAFAYLQQPHDADTLRHLVEIALGRVAAEPGERHLLNRVGTVVVIDDDPDVVQLLAHILQKDGWLVISAEDSAAGQRLLEESSPQIVLLDYHLPGGDGLELLKWTRQNRPDVVVVMVTADTQQDVVVNLIRSGADDFIRKPFDPEVILHACRCALNKYNFLRIHEQFQEKIDRLRSVTEYLDLVINYSQEAIFSCDLVGRVKIWNKGAEKMYGYSADEIMGRVVDEFLDPPDFKRKSPEVVNILRQRGGSFVEPEVLRRRKSGDVFPVYATYSAIYSSGGEYIGFSVIERDVTVSRAFELEKIKSARLRAITQTAVTANDQINTPLGVILGYSQLLQRKIAGLAPEDVAALDVIQQQVTKIKGIMNKLRLMSDPIVKNYSIEGVTMLDLSRSK